MDIALSEECDLKSAEGQLSCLEVLALGGDDASGNHITYYTIRGLLVRTFNEAAEFVLEKGYCMGPFKRNSNSKLIPYYLFFENMLGLNKLLFLSPWIIYIIQKKA